MGFPNIRAFFRSIKGRIQTYKISIKGKISQYLEIIRNLPEEIAYYEKKNKKTI